MDLLRRSLVVALLALGLAASLAQVAEAAGAERVALVIGNSAYQNTAPLANPRNDAADTATALRGVGFEVIEALDADIEAMRQAIRRFGRESRGAEVALLFYAGHGVQVDGRNYMLPTSARLESKLDLSFEAIGLDLPMRIMEQSGAKVRIAILDSCRDNPLVAAAGRSLGAQRGLARIESNAEGTLIAFATAPGTIAADGEGRNSPFTAALKKHLATPGLEIRSLFGRVRSTVLESTDNGQLPWVSEAIQGEFYLVPEPEPEPAPPAQAAAPAPAPAPATAAPSAAGGPQAEIALWNSVKDSNNPRMLEAYLARFPNGLFSGVARIRLDELAAPDQGESGDDSAEETQTAALPPAEAPETEGPDVEIEEVDLAFVAVKRANVRGGPSTAFDKVAQLKVGDEVTVTGRVAGKEWLRIALAEGGPGFVYAPLLTDAEAYAAEQRRREAEEQARREAAAQAATREATVGPAEEPQVAVGSFPTEKLEPGKTFKDCDVCPEMVVIRAGAVMMGGHSNDDERYDNEGPLHRITIAEPFALGVYEVTRRQWQAFVQDSGRDMGSSCWTYENGEGEDREGRHWRNPGHSQGDNHPVTCVSWEDSQAYAAWLSRRTGKTYRLPSEAEWEYAARAGAASSRFWGSEQSEACRYANGADEAARRTYSNWTVLPCDDGYLATAPVGSFAASRFGLYDVLGNVWEWVEDCWNESYDGAPDDGSAWTDGDCENRVLRGASWNDVPRNLRSSDRANNWSGSRNDSNGIRVLREM